MSYRIVTTAIGTRRRARGRRWRWLRVAWCTRCARCLLRLLSLLSLLLVVVIHLRVLGKVLLPLRCVVLLTASRRARGSRCRLSWRALRATGAAISSISTIAAVGTVSSASVALGVTAATAAIAALRRVITEALPLLADVGQQILAELLGTLNIARLRTCNVEVHWLLTFLLGGVVHEGRATAFDLHAAARLVLDMFDIGTALADYLSAEIEPRQRLQVDEDLFLWPFALLMLASQQSPILDQILCRIRHVRTVLVRDDGISARQPDWEAPVS